jgi:L-fucose isomerase-like protein
MQENLGIMPCTVMSMMSHELMSSACEVDICGTVAMHALRLASGTPSALLAPCDLLEIHPDDAARQEIRDGAEVGVESRWGRCRARARLARTCPVLFLVPTPRHTPTG